LKAQHSLNAFVIRMYSFVR